MELKPKLIYNKIDQLFKEITDQEKTISILSNTGFIKGITLRKLISYYNLDQYFSFQIYSDETGYSKPNFEIFKITYDQICIKVDIEKQKILHIGDNLIADYNGAKKFGFKALLIKDAGEY